MSAACICVAQLVRTVANLSALRPSFELRYGLPTLGFALPWLPWVREVLCTGAYYLLEWNGDD